MQEFPWSADSKVTGNTAISSLNDGLLHILKDERGVHIETALCAVGALAGLAVLNATLFRAKQAEELQHAIPDEALVIVTDNAGKDYCFGSWANEYLYPNNERHFDLYSIIAGAALQAGAQKKDLTDFEDIASYIAGVVGGEDFGNIRVPEANKPAMDPITLARELWDFAYEVLTVRPPMLSPGDELPLHPDDWPIIIAIVATRFISMSKDQLAPAIAYQISMESAVITSKCMDLLL